MNNPPRTPDSFHTYEGYNTYCSFMDELPMSESAWTAMHKASVEKQSPTLDQRVLKLEAQMKALMQAYEGDGK